MSFKKKEIETSIRLIFDVYSTFSFTTFVIRRVVFPHGFANAYTD